MNKSTKKIANVARIGVGGSYFSYVMNKKDNRVTLLMPKVTDYQQFNGGGWSEFCHLFSDETDNGNRLSQISFNYPPTGFTCFRTVDDIINNSFLTN